ncbi:MAG: response regulator [Bacteroidota bacterium]
MGKFQILLVEDSPSFAFEVEMLIEEMGYELLDTVDNAEDALAAIDKYHPDLILMDIGLKSNLTGLDVANLIKHLKIPIIFTTSYNDQETYKKAQESHIYGFLVKPFDRLSLQSAIENAFKRIILGASEEQERDKVEKDIAKHKRLLVKQNGILRKIKTDEILFIQGEGNYSTLVTMEKRFVVKMSMKKLLESLQTDIVPIHRSYCVRLDKVDGIDTKEDLIIVGKHKLPLGRRYKPAVLERFNLLK